MHKLTDPDVIDFDMTICTEDDSWILPEGEEYQYHQAEIDSASRHVGEILKMMGYEIPISVEKSLKRTVEWTLKNKKWLEI